MSALLGLYLDMGSGCEDGLATGVGLCVRACACVCGKWTGVQREGPATHSKGPGLLAADSKKSGLTCLSFKYLSLEIFASPLLSAGQAKGLLGGTLTVPA